MMFMRRWWWWWNWKKCFHVQGSETYTELVYHRPSFCLVQLIHYNVFALFRLQHGYVIGDNKLVSEQICFIFFFRFHNGPIISIHFSDPLYRYAHGNGNILRLVDIEIYFPIWFYGNRTKNFPSDHKVIASFVFLSLTAHGRFTIITCFFDSQCLTACY
jgi:hypothetical protein